MPGSTIPEAAGDADNLLLAACSKTLERLGAEVRIRADSENLVRAVRPAAPFAERAAGGPRLPLTMDAWPDEGPDPRPFAVVEACGLANLLHELVHVALAGRLADDHGIDYQAIPFDLESGSGRMVLWDEVAACVVSCAYLLSRRGGHWVEVDGWFDEQLGIQPVFYGMDDEPERFWAMLPRLIATHQLECSAMVECAYDRVAALLASAAGYEVAPRHLSFEDLWRRRSAA